MQGALLTPIISLASATAAARAGEHQAGRAIGQVNMGAVLGIVVAVPAGVALADQLGWRAVFAGLGGLAIVAAAAVLGVLARGSDRAPPAGPAAGLASRDFVLHLVLSGLLFGAMFAAYSYIAAYLETAHGFTTRAVALILLGFGGAGILGNWLAARAVDRGPLRVTLVVALTLVLVGAILPATAMAPPVLFAVLGIWGAAHMAAFVACQVRVMFAGRSAPAFAASLNIAVCNLGIALGTLLGGWITAEAGVAAIGMGMAALGVLACLVGTTLLAGRDAASAAAQSST